MEKNLIFLNPLTDELIKLRDQLSSDSEYETFEIDDISELSQTLPILEQSFVLNGDLKVTRQYLGKLNQYTTSIDCFILLVSDKDIPSHISSSLRSMGLNEVVNTQVTSDILLEKIVSFFEEGYQGISLEQEQDLFGDFVQAEVELEENDSEEWKVQKLIKNSEDNFNKKFNNISLNISTLEKNRIEKLLGELRADGENSTLALLRKGTKKLSFKKNSQEYEVLKKRFVGSKADHLNNFDASKVVIGEYNTGLGISEVKSSDLNLLSQQEKLQENITSREKLIEQELEAQMQEEKSLDEMGLEISKKVYQESSYDLNESSKEQTLYYSEQEPVQVLERYQSYENEESDRSNSSSFEQTSFKKGEGTADFYDAIKEDTTEQRDNFVVSSKLKEGNPFLSMLGEKIPVSLIELESKKEVEIVFPVSNEFLYMVGLSTVLGNEAPNHQKVLMYINFVLNRRFQGIFVPFVISDKSKKSLLTPWELDAFKDTFKDCSKVIDDNFIAFEAFSIPHFGIFNDWGVFIYPYYWERRRCGLGLMLTKKALTESDKKFIELNMLCARNIIFEEYLKC